MIFSKDYNPFSKRDMINEQQCERRNSNLLFVVRKKTSTVPAAIGHIETESKDRMKICIGAVFIILSDEFHIFLALLGHGIWSPL